MAKKKNGRPARNGNEGKKQTMKQLTKHHDKIKISRDKARQEPNPNAKEDLEDLISVSVRQRKK